MPIDYDQAGTLQTNLAFGQRVRVAVTKFANYIANEAPSVSQHNARLRWANTVFQPGGADSTARQIQMQAVMEPQILNGDIDPADGDSTAIDSDVQTATETVANRLI